MIARSRTSAQCVLKDVSSHNRTASDKEQRVTNDATRVNAPCYNLRPRRDAAKARSNEAHSQPCDADDMVDDVDEIHFDDPTLVADYANDIHAYLRSRESLTSVSPLYMKSQKNIDEQMRQILVNFLVEVHFRFGLAPATLYLTVNLLDRYLSSEVETKVTRSNLQLVGIAALFTSSKYEEVWALTSTDCVCVCDNSYSEKDVVDMETSILVALNYEIYVPCAHAFMVRYLKAVDATTDVVNLSNYVLDGTLHSYYLLNFLPSQLAAAAVFISRKTMGDTPWCPELVRHTLYCEEDVLPVARAVIAVKVYCSAGLFAVEKKYGRGGFGVGGASNIELCSDF